MGKIPFISFLMIVLLWACTLREATINSYFDPAFTPGQIKKIAVLPMHNKNLEPYEAQRVNRLISMTLHERNPNVDLINSERTQKIMEKKDLINDWEKFLDEYLTYGRPDLEILSAIGVALDSDAILQGEILDTKQKDGEPSVNVGTSEVTIRFRLFDVNKGRLLWEVCSIGCKNTGTDYETAPPLFEAARIAANKIAENIPLL